jgi:protein-L-isoaspartate(D-aspartate) O-methyltransferase
LALSSESTTLDVNATFFCSDQPIGNVAQRELVRGEVNMPLGRIDERDHHGHKDSPIHAAIVGDRQAYSMSFARLSSRDVFSISQPLLRFPELTMFDTAVQRANMVAAQLRTNDVLDGRLLHAVETIPREIFVPERFRPVAYMERCIELAPNRVLMDARCFGKLAQLAAISPTDIVLNVGCGTGYSAAVLGMLAARVFALDEQEELISIAQLRLQELGARNVPVVRGHLTEGDPAHAPFDVIFLDGAIEVEPKSLFGQLKDGGRLVAVKRDGAAGYGCLYVRHGTAIGERGAFDAWLPVLPGFSKPRGFSF